MKKKKYFTELHKLSIIKYFLSNGHNCERALLFNKYLTGLNVGNTNKATMRINVN
jgi:hypothetical protein